MLQSCYNYANHDVNCDKMSQLWSINSHIVNLMLFHRRNLWHLNGLGPLDRGDSFLGAKRQRHRSERRSALKSA